MFLRLTLLTIILVVVQYSHAQSTLAAWEVSGVRGYGISPFRPSEINQNVVAGWLTKGSGITKTNASNAAANAWGGNGITETSLANAISGNDFITFSITANEGYSMSLTQIPAYNIRRSNTGANSGQWQYRVGSGAFVNIGTTLTWGAITTFAGNPQAAIDLSSIAALQNIAGGTIVSFRLLIWGGTSNQGNWYINNIAGNDLAVTGIITNVSSVSVLIDQVNGLPFSMATCNTTQNGSVSVSTTGIFEPDNMFTVELSTSYGGFAQALKIGEINSTIGGNINFILPENINSSDQYRIRIKSSNPAYTSEPSTPFTITQNGDYCPQAGDYRTRESNNWTSNNTWQVYQYNSLTKNRNWVNCVAGDYPQSAFSNVFIRSTHIVTLNTTPISVKNLVIEQGSKLFRNSTTTNHYLNLAGDLLCNGTFGNGTNSDAISLNIQEGTHTIKGTGSIDCWRIRLSNEFDNGTNGGDATLFVERNINLRWPAISEGSNAMYNALGADSEFNVIIQSGVTLSVINPNASIGIDGANTAIGYENSNRGGGYQVYGSLICAGHLMLGSNNTANSPYFTVEDGGYARFRYLDYGQNNVLDGGELSVATGSVLEIAGAGNNNTTWLNNNVGSILFDIEDGARMRYVGNSEQVIHNLFTYSEFEINKNSGNVHLGSDILIKDKLILTKGVIRTDDNILELGVSTAQKGLLEYTEGYIVGRMKRWFSGINSGVNSSLFPLYSQLDRKSFLTIEYTSAPSSGGSLIATYVNEKMRIDGLPLTVNAHRACAEFEVVTTSGNGFWQIDDGDGLNGGNYSLTLEGEGHGIITDLCELTILKRVNGGDWMLAGDQGDVIGSIDRPILNITNGSGWSNFGFGGGIANPLPVSLTLFEAVYNQSFNEVILRWVTERERNNDYFVVEHSKDAILWTELATVEGRGTTYQSHTYYYNDIEKRIGQNYYRLKQVDIDGAYEYSTVKSVLIPNGNNITNIYPNPAQGSVYIQIGGAKVYDLYISSLEGVLVGEVLNVSKTDDSIIEIDISALNKSVYFITIKTDQFTETHKLVVE